MPDGSEPLTLWRAYVPRWAYQPLSGEGAARLGGRWNAKGQAALYAACELSTAWAEYNQGFVQHPATIVQLELRGAKLADVRDGVTLARYGQSKEIHNCEWRALMDAGDVPPTHMLAAQLIADAFDGVIYPSFMSLGGSCVALWRWNTPEGPSLVATDPEDRLPVTALSWPSRS